MGMRGVMPYHEYSAAEMGWYEAMATARYDESCMDSSSRRRPIPVACTSGNTNRKPR